MHPLSGMPLAAVGRARLRHHGGMPNWIDTHCHLDAAEFDADREAVRQQASAAGVAHCVIPAVERGNWDAVRQLAHHHGDSYALGIHPLYTAQAADVDLALLAQALEQHRHDPRLVAIGEIGLDSFAGGPPQGQKRPPGEAATTRSEGAWGMVQSMGSIPRGRSSFTMPSCNWRAGLTCR